jgi:hypothetical protein
MREVAPARRRRLHLALALTVSPLPPDTKERSSGGHGEEHERAATPIIHQRLLYSFYIDFEDFEDFVFWIIFWREGSINVAHTPLSKFRV